MQEHTQNNQSGQDQRRVSKMREDQQDRMHLQNDKDKPQLKASKPKASRQQKNKETSKDKVIL